MDLGTHTQKDPMMTMQAEIESRTDRRYRLISQAIEDLRPFLKADGGDCELVGVEDDLVRVKMSGACVGCQFASATISGVQERLIAALGMPLRVVPVPSFR
jgi:NifU-like protein